MAAPTERQRASARRVARNSILPFAANLAARVLAWALAVVIARQLGPAGTGAYYVAANLWLYASIVADFGLGTWLTREIARAPAVARDAVRETLMVRLLLGTAAVPLLVAGAALSPTGQNDGRVVLTALLLGIGLVPGAVSAAGTALYNAHERMVFPATIQLASAALTTVLGAAALLSGYDYVALGAVSLAVNLVTAGIFAMSCARDFFPLGLALRPARQVALSRDAFPLMLNNLLNNVFFRIDVQILQTRGSDVVGHYGNAYKVIDAAGAVPSSFVLALFPMLSRRAAAGDGLLTVYRLGLKLLVAVALPVSVLLTYLAADLTLWMWGPEFLPHSAIALQILIWFLPLSFFNGLTQYVLIAAGLQRRITAAFALTAAFNLVANLILIPRYSYVAAAWVTIASEIVLLVPFLLALRGRLPVSQAAVASLRPVPAALGMAGALALLDPWSRLLAVVVAAALYPALLFATVTFDRWERSVIWSLWRAPRGTG